VKGLVLRSERTARNTQIYQQSRGAILPNVRRVEMIAIND